ncbi:uncharacterized protein MEPE_01381 [Melanopsichium pennsylvanicum]|uniref:Uncharacterized protein n=2 Tax=Melanopsichium pennsylvanicum TaxID=63383 RepID=A0AAJ4XIC6_9BASI|nr:hypothetical protein BN887_03986 [Melanopsichium pennsylvanicum 4]SNX82675.1 uncharacterized protein MEPE_01381 [Melanopsichium pennsylvanicum]
MSLSSLVTISDDVTIAPSTYRHLESSEASLGSSDAPTAVNTFSHSVKPPNRFPRRPLQRLPIPLALLETVKDDPVEAFRDRSVGVQLGYGPSPSPHDNDEELEALETFPESPGHSPLSRFNKTSIDSNHRERSYSLSPPAFITDLRQNDSRNQSVSKVHPPGKPLYPSPPRPTPLQLQAEEVLPVPIGKVLKRKPIPASLFVQAAVQEKKRIWSIPDSLSGTNFDESPSDEIEVQNQLGLFIPASTDQKKAGPAKGEEVAVTTSLHDNTNLDSDGAHPRAPASLPRLRRTTRSDSQSYTHHIKNLIGLDLCPNLGDPAHNPTGSDSDRDLVAPFNNERVRTCSGSGAILPVQACLVTDTDQRRYSAGHQHAHGHGLRRMSRRKEGEMRSTYLLSHPSPSASPTNSYCTSAPPFPSGVSYPHCPTVLDTESVEILLTPDLPSQSAFAEQSDAVSSYPLSLGQHLNTSFNSSKRSRMRSSWERSLASRARSSSEGSMASLLVLQQHIQVRNHLRQIAPPSADPYSPTDYHESRRSREPIFKGLAYPQPLHHSHQSANVGTKAASPVAEEVPQRWTRDPLVGDVPYANDMDRKPRISAMEESQDNLVQQYGALRIKNWTSTSSDSHLDGKFDDDGRFPYLAPNDSVDRDKKEGGLRHMLSSSLLVMTTAANKGSANGGQLGSLRQRRAKPPISIAINNNKSDEAVVVGPYNSPLRKKLSRTQFVSQSSTNLVISPPPCPPPATPLPELPVPESAPVVEHGVDTDTDAIGCASSVLFPKRSFVRSNSTSVSALNTTPLRNHQHGSSKSQPHNHLVVAPSNQHRHVAVISSNNVSELEWQASSTPPLIDTPGLVFDHQETHQPKTPLSAMSAITPVRPTAINSAEKFDSLLSFLSPLKSGKDNLSGSSDETETQNKKSAFEHGEGSDVVISGSIGVTNGVVYGLAL